MAFGIVNVGSEELRRNAMALSKSRSLSVLIGVEHYFQLLDKEEEKALRRMAIALSRSSEGLEPSDKRRHIDFLVRHHLTFDADGKLDEQFEGSEGALDYQWARQLKRFEEKAKKKAAEIDELVSSLQKQFPLVYIPGEKCLSSGLDWGLFTTGFWKGLNTGSGYRHTVDFAARSKSLEDKKVVFVDGLGEEARLFFRDEDGNHHPEEIIRVTHGAMEGYCDSEAVARVGMRKIRNSNIIRRNDLSKDENLGDASLLYCVETLITDVEDLGGVLLDDTRIINGQFLHAGTVYPVFSIADDGFNVEQLIYHSATEGFVTGKRFIELETKKDEIVVSSAPQTYACNSNNRSGGEIKMDEERKEEVDVAEEHVAPEAPVEVRRVGSDVPAVVQVKFEKCNFTYDVPGAEEGRVLTVRGVPAPGVGSGDDGKYLGEAENVETQEQVIGTIDEVVAGKKDEFATGVAKPVDELYDTKKEEKQEEQRKKRGCLGSLARAAVAAFAIAAGVAVGSGLAYKLSPEPTRAAYDTLKEKLSPAYEKARVAFEGLVSRIRGTRPELEESYPKPEVPAVEGSPDGQAGYSQETGGGDSAGRVGYDQGTEDPGEQEGIEAGNGESLEERVPPRSGNSVENPFAGSGEQEGNPNVPEETPEQGASGRRPWYRVFDGHVEALKGSYSRLRESMGSAMQRLNDLAEGQGEEPLEERTITEGLRVSVPIPGAEQGREERRIGIEPRVTERQTYSWGMRPPRYGQD